MNNRIFKILICPKCKRSLPESQSTKKDILECGYCNTKVSLFLYPHFDKDLLKGKKAENIILSEHASCFFHPEKLAVIHCEECGVFLCSLCDIEIEGKHLCSKCIKKQSDNFETLRNSAILYDSILLTMAVIPIFLFWPVIITAPLTIFGCFYYRKKIKTPYKRNLWRLYTALVIATLQIVGIIALITFLITKG